MQEHAMSDDDVEVFLTLLHTNYSCIRKA